MEWPHSQEYNEAIQSPRSSFGDPELRQARPSTNALGLPMPRSGNFADVYELRCPASRLSWAVKCFTRERPGLRERYDEIGRYLRRVRLPFMIDFNFLEQGIWVHGRWYPVVKMPWVEGLLLNEFVQASLDRPVVLQGLAEVWLRMGRRLHEARLAHGDLQHGNVILVPGRDAGSLTVKLIDYDGMYVPALAGRKSGEVGHRNYQHPQRLREGSYGPEVDRFPLLVIYVAVRSLVIGGRSLWDRYDNGDNLLFKEADFAAPHQSALFAELLQLDDPEARSVAARLMAAAQKPLEQTPQLEELAPNSAGSPSITKGKLNWHGTTMPGERAESLWATTPPPVRAPIPQAITTPAETAESLVAQATPGPSSAGKPTKGRAMLMRALICAAATVLCCLGLGALISIGSRDKPGTSDEVAKGNPSPQMAKDMSQPAAEFDKGPLAQFQPKRILRVPREQEAAAKRQREAEAKRIRDSDAHLVGEIRLQIEAGTAASAKGHHLEAKHIYQSQRERCRKIIELAAGAKEATEAQLLLNEVTELSRDEQAKLDAAEAKELARRAAEAVKEPARQEAQKRADEARRALGVAKKFFEDSRYAKVDGDRKAGERLTESGIARLKKIVEDYPKTKAAAEAKEMLDELGE